MQRALIAFVMVAVLAATGWQTVTRYLAWQSRNAAAARADSWGRGNIHSDLTSLAAGAAYSPAPAAGPVYPYSVIPGGIRDSIDLERAAHHDRVVWLHYALFQYRHARLVRATEAREVYLSYRLHNRIFWTRKRHRLQVGELLLTDGQITARTRCGNQISDQPKPEVSEEEPSEDVLDRPAARPDPAPALPMYSLLHRPTLQPVGPQEAFNVRGFIFPLVPVGLPIAPGCEASKANQNGGNAKPCVPKRHKPPVVPEPSTLLLISSGIAAIGWRYRRASRAAKS